MHATDTDKDCVIEETPRLNGSVHSNMIDVYEADATLISFSAQQKAQ